MGRNRLVTRLAPLLGVCIVVLWSCMRLRDTTDVISPISARISDRTPFIYASANHPRVTGTFDPHLEAKIDIDLNKCTDVHLDHEILTNRLNILQEYIPSPANYSKKFDNPCWYDFHQKPIIPHTEAPDCRAVGMTYEPKLVHNVLKQAKKPGESHLYCLPALYLLGFPKCATTTLYKMLIKHPLIADTQCRTKESQFWSMFMRKQERDIYKKMQTLHYLTYYSRSIKTIEANPLSKIVDGSVSYLIWTTWTTTPFTTESEFCTLPSLFMRVLPEAKFIVIMRNPTERVFSHYYYYSVIRASKTNDSRNVDSTTVFESFHKLSVEAIQKFQTCIDGGHSAAYCVRQKGIDGDVTSIDGCVGIQTSLYYYHIVPWLSVIPRERFLFLRTEDLAYAPQLTMTKVWNFLNLDDFPDNIRLFENINRQADHLEVFPQTKKLLDDFFLPYNQLLAHLLLDMNFLWND